MLRQIAALCFAATLAWDYSSRYDYLFRFFSTWSLIVQFIYFQLPSKSRALSFAHSLAFICATTVPLQYLYSLLWNPLMEINNAAEWEISYSTVIIRSILVHFVPIFFHAIDITTHQTTLIISYQYHPRRIMVLWSIVSYSLYGFIFDFFNPRSSYGDASESISVAVDLSAVEHSESRWPGKILIPTGFFIFSFFLLTMLILRPAYNVTKFRIRSTSVGSSNSRTSFSSHIVGNTAVRKNSTASPMVTVNT